MITTSELIVRPIPYREPTAAFAAIAHEPFAALLDGTGLEQSRYAFICWDPFDIITLKPGDDYSDPFRSLRAAMTTHIVHRDGAGLPSPFVGGAVGFVGYEIAHALEVLPTRKPAAFPFDLAFGLYDVVAVFDLRAKAAWVISSGFPEKGAQIRRQRAQHRAETLEGKLGLVPISENCASVAAQWVADQSATSFEQRVQRIIEYIRAGDIFQANLTQRWCAEVSSAASMFELYRRLKHISAAPFAAYMSFDIAHQIVSASPERFLSVSHSGHVETRPIKGTRPRGTTPDQDRAFANELLASAKDRAENLMIVDLLRNDISRVCQPGSVGVPSLCALETFPAVHHLVSVVTGQLRQDATAVDLLAACFPGGSVTGAPKIRAMEIIHELEPVARGPYCGSMAWLGFDGAMDSSILIRTMVRNRNIISAQAGGGIVADSIPAAEYEESVLKAKPLLQALTGHHRFTCASV